MLDRFTGPEGPRLIKQLMLDQQSVAHSEPIAKKLCEVLSICSFKEKDPLMTQGASDNDLYFILAGKVAIFINGREMAVRTAGLHVGEMALIDPKAGRSATVIALEPVVAAKVSEPNFTQIAEKHPTLWRRIALELGNRLRERGKYVRYPNDRPEIFIGSSKEGLAIANAIQAGLAYDYVVPTVWTNNVFIAGHLPLEDLEARLNSADFGVLVFHPDDRVINEERNVDKHAPRDNVILELGMCIGAMGRKRALFVVPRGVDLKIPSDLIGTKPIDYIADDPKHIDSHIGPVCTAIRGIVNDLGPR